MPRVGADLMRIAFVLPGRSVKPSGGFKVVYEYANLLTRRGHEVSVVHPWECVPVESLTARIRGRLWVEWFRRRRRAIAPWFDLDTDVRLPLVTDLSTADLPRVDALIATAWHTAPWVSAAAPGKGAGFYLIQGYETWDGDVETVRETWRLPLRKIVISSWLEEIAMELGEGGRTSRVPIGLDLERLGIDVPLKDREPRIGAIWSAAKAKGGDDIVAALGAVKERAPGVGATMYGTAPRPEVLPAWVEYTMLPDPKELRAIYNSCSIFIQASRSEGWGLPACEAMICGCALVTVANGGSREYAVDGETALVVPPDAGGDLAAPVAELLEDDELRRRLAERGHRRLQQFTWERSVTELEGVLARANADREPVQ
jgi:glycosyltransferase involved in cell wall biosynthesis